MVLLRFVIFYWIAIALLAGCSIDNHNGDSSTIIFKLPKSSYRKTGTIAGFPADSCFAINIIGDKIDAKTPGSCDASYGVFAGLIPNGGEIELTAPYGKNRTIEIFYVQIPGGCGTFKAESGLGQTYGSNLVHRIAHSTGHNFDKPVVEAVVNFEYPNGSNTIGTLLKLPSTCEIAAAPPPPPPSPIPAVPVSTAGLALGSANGATANGSKVFVRIVNQNLDLNNTTGSSAHVRPVRLGESQ